MSLPFDVSDYEVVRAPVVDTFDYAATDPETKTEIRVPLNEAFLRRTAEKMNERSKTNDLCPIVVGHTIRGAREVDQPPKVGYLHRFEVEPYNGKPALFADHYIRKVVKLALNGVEQTLTAKELVDRFPRRSGEVWFGTHEIDPHALLGATTPHRNLGVLKLSADGNAGFSYESPGDLKVDKPTEAPKTGEYAELKALVQQIAAMVASLTEAFHAAVQPEPQPQGHGDSSIDDILKGLEAEEGGEKGGEEKEPKEPKGDKGGDKEPKGGAETEEVAKLQRERDEALVKLARVQITSRLAAQGHDTNNEQLIADLICQPEDVRERFLARLERPRGTVARPPSAFDTAVASATADSGKRITSAAQREQVLKLAREENSTFEVAARKLGFTIPN